MAQLKRESNPPPGLIASPEPQYWNDAIRDYETLKGQHGAPYASLINTDGEPINPATKEGVDALKTVLQSKDFATEVTLDALRAELTLVKQELEAIKANQVSGAQKVQLSGNIDSLRGLFANRPEADAEGITPGRTTYTAVDDGWVYVSDGAEWRKWLEVGTWT